MWRADNALLFAVLPGHTKFSPDGKLVLTAGEDGMLRLYRCDLCAGIDGLAALAKRRLAALAPSGR